MIILGIDPGTASCGFGVIEKKNKKIYYKDHGVIKTDSDTLSELRLRKIHLSLNKIIRKHNPDLMSVEKLYFFKNAKTLTPVSEAKGVVKFTAARKKIKVKEYTPLQVKMCICGYGRAKKKQVQKMVKKILKLDKIPKPNDAADGLGLAITASFEEGPVKI